MPFIHSFIHLLIHSFQLKLDLRELCPSYDFGEHDKLKCSAFTVLFVQFTSKYKDLLWLTWSRNQQLVSRFDFQMQCHLKMLYKFYRLVTGFQRRRVERFYTNLESSKKWENSILANTRSKAGKWGQIK